ncbi:MAG: hypothetical protein MUE70_08835 [Desulfobacterales bacterium]|jgi:hypothetical protein|nr:hypothetical protein [Desulfobacterales bacterium]
MNLRTCVDPSGKFIYGVHKPKFRACNLREQDYIEPIGWSAEGAPVDNRSNFPDGFVDEPDGDAVYEIPNPFPFRGTTFILKKWADQKAKSPESIFLPPRTPVSFSSAVRDWGGEVGLAEEKSHSLMEKIPGPIRLAIASVSTDPADLMVLARLSCEFVFDSSGSSPLGLKYHPDSFGKPIPLISDHLLFEIVANNPALPDEYKEAMVLRPGVQGGSEIVGEWRPDSGKSHIFEYLRRNSYIPGGHYAANMANDSVRYRAGDLSFEDMRGLRHLYYQRTYVRLALDLGIEMPPQRKTFSKDALEALRLKIIHALSGPTQLKKISHNRTLWGWNFGFDYAPSGYRLHASHQQIHQQFAMIPSGMGGSPVESFRHAVDFTPYACGDLIADFIAGYQTRTGKDFFETYLRAIDNNERMDGANKENSLVIYTDSRVILFVPKAQTSQWEVQIMALQPVGNILEADADTRQSLDAAILIAVRILEQLGARMITCIEYSKPLDSHQTGQRLLYAFLPRLPESPGAFSEAQLRWISGHYPEDFAAACRRRVSDALVMDL